MGNQSITEKFPLFVSMQWHSYLYGSVQWSSFNIYLKEMRFRSLHTDMCVPYLQCIMNHFIRTELVWQLCAVGIYHVSFEIFEGKSFLYHVFQKAKVTSNKMTRQETIFWFNSSMPFSFGVVCFVASVTSRNHPLSGHIIGLRVRSRSQHICQSGSGFSGLKSSNVDFSTKVE